MLQVKFFRIDISEFWHGDYYVKARHDGVEVDCTRLYNVYEQVAPYIKQVMSWGYSRSEIEFIIDPTCGDWAAESITRDIDIYAN